MADDIDLVPAATEVMPAPPVVADVMVGGTSGTAVLDADVVGAVVGAAALPVSGASTFKVRINAGGRDVELETTDAPGGLDALALTALTLWRATAGAVHPPDGESLFGLVGSERSDDRKPSSTMDGPVSVPR